jgi:hypothetical protein
VRFGLLSLALQVQWAVALAHARRNGLRLAPQARAQVLAAVARAQSGSGAVLGRDKQAIRCFKQNGSGKIRYKPDGSPAVRPRTFSDWLGRVFESAGGLHGTALNAATAEGGRPSRSPDDWGAAARSDPLLRACSDLSDAAGLLPHFAPAGATTLHPRWEVLPRIGSREPDLDALRRCCESGLFKPPPGRVFLALELPDLELRALAAVCRQGLGRSRLADLFAAGDDPHEYAAAALAGLPAADFAALRANDAQSHARWLRIARALLTVVPTGLSVHCVREAARLEFGLDDLGLAEATRLHGRLLGEVFPELGDYLRDDTLEVMAGNLNVRPDALSSALAACRPRNPPSLPEVRRWFGADAGRLTADRQHDLRTMLRTHNANESLAPLVWRGEFSPELYVALFGRRVVTLTGRARGGLLFSDARQARYFDLADDAAKAALFALAAGGWKVLAFAKGVVITEVEAGTDLGAKTEEGEALAGRAVEDVLGVAGRGVRGVDLDRW